jgi:hypothetical protein
MSETTCGRVGKNTLSYCADRAADAIVSAAKTLAVCLAPDGIVTVEPVAGAIEDEIVGVYTADAGKFALWGLIEGDLRESQRTRRVSGGTYHRHRVAPGSKAA